MRVSAWRDSPASCPASVLVHADEGRSALALRNLDGDDLLGELFSLVRRRPPLLALQRELILIRPADLVLAGDILGSLAHGEGVMQRRHARIDQAPADRSVEDLLRPVE